MLKKIFLIGIFLLLTCNARADDGWNNHRVMDSVDVDRSNAPTNGQTLVYNSTTELWYPGTPGSGSYQPLATILTTLSNLSNASGVLTNDGHGVLSWGAGGGSMVYPGSAGIAIMGASTWGTSITDNHSQWDSAYSAIHNPVSLDTNAQTVLSLSTQALGLQTQTANTVWAGRVSAGTALVPTFRSLVALDIPDLSGTYLPLGGKASSSGNADTVTNGIYLNGAYTNGFMKWNGASQPTQDTSTYLTAESDPVVKAIVGVVKSNGTTISACSNLTDVAYLTSVTAHNLLSTTHGDTTADTVVRGDIITGQGATPKWDRLAFPATPTGKVLQATATDVAWSSSALGTMAFADTGSYALVGQTFYIGTTQHAINRASAAEDLAGITSLTPGADFTISQNSVVPFTSVNSGAIVNTLYLKAGNVGIGTTGPTALLNIKAGTASVAPFQLTSGTVLTSPVAGSIEYDGTDLWITTN